MNHLALAQIRILITAKFQNYSPQPAHVEQSFLFVENRYQGIRFRNGQLTAEWLFDDNFVSIKSNQTLIERATVPDEASKRAA
jgi:hypothetical protein